MRVPDWAPDGRGLGLAVGDHLAIAAIVAYGIVDHNGTGALTEVGEVVETLGPFVGGFLITALLVGCYRTQRHDTLLASLRSTLAAWFGGLGLGLVVRTWPEIEGGATWPFGLVILGAVSVGLVAWRVGAHLAWLWYSGADQPGRREPAGE